MALKFEIGRLDRQSYNNEVGRSDSNAASQPSPVNSRLSVLLTLNMLPSMFLAAPVALSLFLPIASAVIIGHRATTCNGFSDVRVDM